MNQHTLKVQSADNFFNRSVVSIIVLALSAWQGVTAEPASGAEDASQGANRQLAIVKVKPTVLLKEEQGRLVRMVDITVKNGDLAVSAEVEVMANSWRGNTVLGTVEQGERHFQVKMPDLRQNVQVTFALKADGQVQDQREISVEPARHWSVFFVPITHHDLGYTDTIENVMNRYDEFYDDVLRFCDLTNDWPEEAKYRYTIEGAWSAQHFLRNRPMEAIGKLGKYVKEGRIEVGALYGNEIGAICGHEEQIRLMYPSFRLQRQLGGEILTGSITDVPGLSWGLPTVMAGAGVKYFFAGLPTYFEWGRNDIHTFWDESAVLRKGRPDAFRWEGPDGRNVLVYYQSSYGFFARVIGPDSYEEVLEHLPRMLGEMEGHDSPFDVARYIHNGVDNYPPKINISEIVREWNSKWAFPKLIVGTNSMFFKELEKQCGDIRTFRGELPDTDYVVGAVSTAKETSMNRLTHDKLLTAEKVALAASFVGDYEYPGEKIADAYDNALLYDEHTWGKDYPAGPEQDWAWNEKSHFAYKAAGLAQWVLRKSMEHIAFRVNMPEEGYHIIVFNPLSRPRTDVVRLTKFYVPEPFEVVDTETGEAVSYQVVELAGPQTPAPYAAYRHARGQFEKHELFDLVFLAKDVPSVGYKTYRVAPVKERQAAASGVAVGDGTLENRFYKIRLDPKTGAVASIYDKELGRELVDREAQAGVNQFVARWVQSGKVEGPKSVTIRKGQAGLLYGSLVVEAEGAGCPQIVQEIMLHDKVKRIDFANRVLKDSTAPMEIYFAFPFKVDNPRFRYEGSNSVIEPVRDQFPGSNTNYYAVQHWANVSDGKMGITLSSIDSHLMEFGGLWPCYVSQAHHGVTAPYFGKPFTTAEQMSKGHIYAFVMDSNFRTNFQPVQQSDILFRYSLTTHDGDLKLGRCHEFGWSAGNPLVALALEGKRNGSLESKMSFCEIDKANVSVTAMKRAEDGDGIIIRLIETEGKPAEATVTLPHLKIKKAWRTNLVEQNEKELSPSEHAVTAPIKAFGISTIRVQI